MITLRKAAFLYDANERTILYWAKQNKITITKVGESYMVDDVALSKLFAHNIRWGNKYLEEEIKIRQEQMSEALLQIDDLIYLFKSIKRIEPIFRFIISEMEALITHEQKKAVFKEVISGKGISEVAQKHGISFARACYLYDSALEIIRSHHGILANYLSIVTKKEYELKKLRIQNTNLKIHIQNIHTAVIQDCTYYNVFTKMVDENIPMQIIDLLSQNLHTKLKLDTRITNCLKAFHIETVEHFIRFIQDEGFDNFLNCRNLGKKSLKLFKAELLKHGIINKDGTSDLFVYIEPRFNRQKIDDLLR